MGKIIDRILEKGFSGRFYSTVTIISVYCIVVTASLYLVYKKLMEVEVFMGIFIVFAQLAKQIVESYFSIDRKQGTTETKTEIKTEVK